MAAYTAIDDPTLFFSATVYTGDGANDRAVTVAGTGMQPDMVWIKSRSEGEGHVLGDAVRGVNRKLVPNDTDSESSGSSYTNISTITSTGFTLSATGGGVDDAVNKDTATYVAWCWKETATAGFDIVSFEGTGSAHTEAHSLSAKPLVVIAKNRERTADWLVYHAGMDATGDYTLFLHSTSAKDNTQNYWGDTEATTSNFSVGTRLENNYSGEDIIAYCFAPKQGYSKFGSYTGNGNADGPFIHLGFRPAWIMTKITSGVDNWQVCDNKRDTDNAVFSQLNPDSTDAQNDGDAKVDFLSNGFKIRKSGGSWNGSGSTFVYMAFAEAPFVNSNGVPCNAR